MLPFPRPARRGSLIFLISVLLIVGILAHRSRFLIGLLFENGYPDIINPIELLCEDEYAGKGSKAKEAIELIPKIIHQTYINTSVPDNWIISQKACKGLHEGWEYMFWTDETARQFIGRHYPSFLPTYDAYPYPIQRVDSFRYFILYHHGGIYLDLDIEPYRPLSPLLQYPSFACRTSPTGISNDALGAAPRHPFYKLVIERLQDYNKNWGLPYMTIMYSTGPLFLSVVWEEYLGLLRSRQWRSGAEEVGREEKVWVLSRETRYENTYGFFNNHEGGSWHGKDMVIIFWMGEHLVIVTIIGVVMGLALVAGLWLCVRKLTGAGEREREGYKPIMRNV